MTQLSSAFQMEDLGKKKTPNLVKFPVAPPANKTQSTIDSTSVKNLIFFLVATLFVFLIPYQEAPGGTRLPKVIFNEQPTPFNLFILCVMFGFSSSFCALFSSNRPNLARFFRSGSTVFLASLVVLLFYAAFHTSGSRSRAEDI